MPEGGSNQFMTIGMIVVMFALLYFVMIRPQKKRDKLVKEMLAGLVVGDKIITIGGINGKIVSLKDETVVIEIGQGNEKSTMKISRWAIKEIEKPAEA